MPRQQILPTWVAWNNANFPTASGLQDLRTGQEFPAGGLNLGDYFEATEKEANDGSMKSIGLLHSGQYRLVRVDAGATAANVKTGTVGYMRAGTFVQGVVVTAVGTGGTPGTYNIPATVGSGGGSGAVIQVVVAAGGAVASASVLQGGQNYTSVPAFPLTVTGGSGTVAGQLNASPNLVTSFDQAVTLARPVVFLNSITPGNYGFVQELGVATVLGNATIGTGAAVGNWVGATTSGAGTVSAPVATTSPTTATIGIAVDLPVASNLFKVVLTVPVVQD